MCPLLIPLLYIFGHPLILSFAVRPRQNHFVGFYFDIISRSPQDHSPQEPTGAQEKKKEEKMWIILNIKNITNHINTLQILLLKNRISYTALVKKQIVTR